MRVLLIHGRGQADKDPVALEKQWVDTLESGFEAAGRPWPTDVEFDFPYYGDVLDELVERANLRDPDDVAAKGAGAQREYETFMQQVLTEMQETHPDLSEAAIRAAYPAEDIGTKGPQNWGWVRAIARFVDDRWAGAASFTIESFLRDVHMYVNIRQVTKRVDDIVVERLTTEPTLVIGHSLGSVVGYNVLKNRSPDVNIIGYLTVGSPLGLRSISSRLGVPAQVAAPGRWFNAFDPRDIVALNPLDATHFSTNPAIENHAQVSNVTSSRHGIVGYLNDARVAEWVADVMASAV